MEPCADGCALCMPQESKVVDHYEKVAGFVRTTFDGGRWRVILQYDEDTFQAIYEGSPGDPSHDAEMLADSARQILALIAERLCK